MGKPTFWTDSFAIFLQAKVQNRNCQQFSPALHNVSEFSQHSKIMSAVFPMICGIFFSFAKCVFLCFFQLCHELDQSGLNRAGLLREASRPAKPSAGGRGRLEGRELGPVEAPGDGGEALAWVYQYFS